jgi:DNA-binding FadR family transcriptional regulator
MRAADVIANMIRDDILSGAIPAGTMLPAERLIAEQSGFGRASVREALKTLALEGLVTIKVGRNGGYLVQEPARDSVVRSLDLFIRARRIPGNSLLEIREIIEPECAAFAAERRTQAEARRLRVLTERMALIVNDVPAYLDLNIEWHVLVAEISHNDVLAAFMTAISQSIRISNAVEEYDSPDMLRAAQRLHESVLDSIIEQDPGSARRRMHRHLHAASEVVRTITTDES